MVDGRASPRLYAIAQAIPRRAAPTVGTRACLEADARRQRPRDTIEADLCIVGAGPAGLSLAHALLGSGLQVVVLESGGRDFDRVAQALNEAQVVGSAYGDLLQTRQRQVGGTANAWNSEVDGEVAAKFVPLDNLCLSPQCGFSSTHHGNALSFDEQWKKLALCVEVAREVWG